MSENKNNENLPKMIKIGRLKVDPIFLMLFLFFTFSGVSLFLFIFLSYST